MGAHALFLGLQTGPFAEDLEAKVGRIDRFTPVADVVQRFEVSLLPTKTEHAADTKTT
jgi:hypothetical protein